MKGINCNVALQTKWDAILKMINLKKIRELDISKEEWE